jgi:hypothetical protein
MTSRSRTIESMATSKSRASLYVKTIKKMNPSQGLVPDPVPDLVPGLVPGLLLQPTMAHGMGLAQDRLLRSTLTMITSQVKHLTQVKAHKTI